MNSVNFYQKIRVLIFATAVVCEFGCASKATSFANLQLVPDAIDYQGATITSSQSIKIPRIQVSNSEIINFDGSKIPIVINQHDGYLDVPDSSYRGDTLDFISKALNKITNQKVDAVAIIPDSKTQYILLKGILRSLTYSGVSKVYLPFSDKLYPMQLPRKISNNTFVQSINSDSLFFNILVLNDSIRVYTGILRGDWQVKPISDLSDSMRFNQDLNILETGKNVAWISIDPHPGCRYERISSLLDLVYARSQSKGLYKTNLLGFMPASKF